MSTPHPEEQMVFNAALQAALDTEEVQTVMTMTGVAEAELRDRVIAAGSEIWERVRHERRRVQDLLDRLAAAERSGLTPRDVKALHKAEDRAC
jgi:hypothetical protein